MVPFRAPPVTRRLFLRGATGAALALPLFSSLPRALAQGVDQAAAPPKRLILFYTPNGTKKELWRPPHEPGALSDLGPLLEPLRPHLRHLNLLDGVDLQAGLEGPGGPHQRGLGSLFTGNSLNEGEFADGDGRKAGWAKSASIDQLVAQAVGGGTPFRSLELGVRVLEPVPRARMCYAGPDQPLPPENDPRLVYQRLFAGLDEPPALAARRLRRRASALDAVLADLRRLEGRLDAADRAKLQRHAEGVRELERRLSLLGGGGLACAPAAPAPYADVLSEQAYGDVARAQVDLLVSAFACDQTRVGSLQCSSAVNALRLSFLTPPVSGDGHSLSHAGDTNAELQGEWDRVLMWYSELFAYLLARLDAVPEGDGTLLDHTVVLWGNELSRGNTHDLTDIPFVLTGGGLLPGGRYLRYGGVPHNQLLLALAHAFGIEVTEFGAPHLNGGALSGLLG